MSKRVRLVGELVFHLEVLGRLVARAFAMSATLDYQEHRLLSTILPDTRYDAKRLLYPLSRLLIQTRSDKGFHLDYLVLLLLYFHFWLSKKNYRLFSRQSFCLICLKIRVYFVLYHCRNLRPHLYLRNFRRIEYLYWRSRMIFSLFRFLWQIG